MQITQFLKLINSRAGYVAAFLSLLVGALALLPPPDPLTAKAVFPATHALLEIISVIIGSAIFVLIWESRHHRSSGTLLLGCGLMATVAFDLGHLLSCPDMPDFFTPNSMEKAINFWLAARFTLTTSLLVYALGHGRPPLPGKENRSSLIFGTLGYFLAVSAIILAYPAIIPATFVPGIGPTALLIFSDRLLLILNLLTALLIARRYLVKQYSSDLWLAATAWVLALASAFLTIRATASPTYALLGIAYKIIAYLLAYWALVSSIIRQPYEKLASESRRNRTILETALDGIHVVDMNGRVIDTNSAFAGMLGYTVDEMLKLHVSDFEGTKTREQVAEQIEAIRQGDRNTMFETLLRHKDGKLIEAEVAINLAHLSDEEFLVVSARNITDRKAADSLRLAGEVFKHAHVGLLITDNAGTIVEVNPVACEITGYEYDELIGKNPSLLKSGQHTADFYEEMWLSLCNQGFWSQEICNRRKNGELYYELLSITAIRDHTGHHINYLAVFSDITQRKIAEDQMRKIAHFDALTGLPNRLLLADRLDQAIAQHQRSSASLAICFMDLDGFKQINDTLGHEAGDLLLKEVGARLQAMLRGSDTVARLGGDEFVMLISGLNSDEECIQALERVLHSVRRPYFLLGDTQSEISVSIGVTLYPADNADADSLMRHADHAMYAAKQAGKNCFQLFDARMEQRLQARHDTLRRVARGLTAGQFQLHYQPKVDYSNQQVIGVEALIRWNHPILGNLTPNEFLPLLEDDDLALALGEWVFREALRQGRQWESEGISLCISVNAFPRQLQRPNFPGIVAKAIEDVWPEMAAGKFMIEITETAALRELDSIEKTIQACREQGVAFSLDDFGTGYSSLSYLRQLTVDELKIDQSFVRDMLTDHEDLSIINGLLGLGHAFKLKVVAEGVESAEHVNALLRLGCYCMQGYGIARPMPAEKLVPWLQEFSQKTQRN